MAPQKSIIVRRVGVILTYTSLICIVLIFEYSRGNQWTSFLIVFETIAFVFFLIGFVLTYLKIGLWSFIHRPLKKLDEREIALTSKSLRYAYGIFTIVILVVLLSFAVMVISVSIVLVASLILFAHLLPASFIAWTEKLI